MECCIAHYILQIHICLVFQEVGNNAFISVLRPQNLDCAHERRHARPGLRTSSTVTHMGMRRQSLSNARLGPRFGAERAARRAVDRAVHTNHNQACALTCSFTSSPMAISFFTSLLDPLWQEPCSGGIVAVHGVVVLMLAAAVGFIRPRVVLAVWTPPPAVRPSFTVGVIVAVGTIAVGLVVRSLSAIFHFSQRGRVMVPNQTSR